MRDLSCFVTQKHSVGTIRAWYSTEDSTKEVCRGPASWMRSQTQRVGWISRLCTFPRVVQAAVVRVKRGQGTATSRAVNWGRLSGWGGQQGLSLFPHQLTARFPAALTSSPRQPWILWNFLMGQKIKRGKEGQRKGRNGSKEHTPESSGLLFASI